MHARILTFVNYSVIRKKLKFSAWPIYSTVHINPSIPSFPLKLKLYSQNFQFFWSGNIVNYVFNDSLKVSQSVSIHILINRWVEKFFAVIFVNT